jgi:murein DD-endopeptidase MepM/ murein hydrolase activator NlpD
LISATPQKSGNPSQVESRSPLVDNSDSIQLEGSRSQACNRAAMLSMAISVGTCGALFTPFVHSAANAAEAVAEALSTTPVSTATVATIAAPAPTNAAAVATLAPQATHKVLDGETLSLIAQRYSVDVSALAGMNQIPTDAALKPGQLLTLPSLKNLPSQPTAAVTSLQQLAETTANVPVVATVQPTNPVPQSAAAIERDAKVRQEEALNALREKRNQLQQSVAELGREESKQSEVAGVQIDESVVKTDESLPVTTLAKTPLPAIGGEAPKSVAIAPATEMKADAAQFDNKALLAEINSIRQRYQSQSNPYQAKAEKAEVLVAQVGDTVVPVVKAAASTKAEAPKAVVAAANPDFDGRKQDSALSIELRNFVQPKLKPEGGSEKAVAPVANRQVASASLGSEVYAPVAPSVQRMVAPNLPALGSGDAYLPGGGSSSRYVWPSRGVLSSGYGWRWGRMHRGIDIAAAIGTPIVSVASGTVVYAGWNDGGYGYMVEVEHADGTMTRYAHNDRLLVSKGQQVNQGQQISEMGSTGFSTGPHLHFEIHPRGQGAVNPMALMNQPS